MATISILRKNHICLLDYDSLPNPPVVWIDGVLKHLSERKRLSLKATIEDAIAILEMEESDEIPAYLID